MASSNHLTRLKAIRDNLEKELEDETLRRATLTAAGDPPPATYNVSGKSVDWNGYITTMVAQIKAINDLIIAAGGDDGGIPEAVIYMG